MRQSYTFHHHARKKQNNRFRNEEYNRIVGGQLKTRAVCGKFMLSQITSFLFSSPPPSELIRDNCLSSSSY